MIKLNHLAEMLKDRITTEASLSNKNKQVICNVD